jgi:hypothetical protein
MSYINAAITAAIGLAQVNAIRSTSWSGGGSSAGVSGGGGGAAVSATPSEPTPAPRSEARGVPVINITITGLVGRVDAAMARIIGEALGREINSNDFEFMNPNSRQVLTIRGAGGAAI